LRLAKTTKNETGLLRTSQRRLNLKGLIVKSSNVVINHRLCEAKPKQSRIVFVLTVFASLRSRSNLRRSFSFVIVIVVPEKYETILIIRRLCEERSNPESLSVTIIHLTPLHLSRVFETFKPADLDIFYIFVIKILLSIFLRNPKN